MDDATAEFIGDLIGKQGGALAAISGAIVDALCQQPSIDADKLRADIKRHLARPGSEAWDLSVLQAFAEHLQPRA